jgi:ATP-dependent Clp protease ATP-binding subunit ClpA
MPPNLSALIEEVEEHAPSGEPLDLLATASSSVEELNDLSDALLSHFVDRCRRAGHSWAEIGVSLGVTRQAVQQRFTAARRELKGSDRFTERALEVVNVHCPAAALELGHGYIGTEHVLLALWGDPECLAVLALERLGLGRDSATAAIEALIPRGEATEITGGFTPRAWVALGNTVGEALGLGHNYVGTEHMLLALLGGVGGVAAEVLGDAGIDHDRARAVVVELLSGYRAAPTPP